jgi:triphosphoribosyl-dephospho-CoA synthetase
MSEKAIARKIFYDALNRELQDIIEKARQKASQITDPADLWELEAYLTASRKEIDCKYDYRYSELMPVLGRLLSEQRITEEELHGLQGDKVNAIRSCAKLLAGNAA